MHIKPLEREEWTNVVSSFKVAPVDLKTTSTDDLQGPLSASYDPGSCIKLILFDQETWSTWNHQPLPFLPRGRKNRKEKDFSYWTQSLARLQIWSGAQDWMYRDVSQLNWTWSNGWFQCNSINLIFFFVETIKKFKCCIHKLHLGLNGGIFSPTEMPLWVALQFPFIFPLYLSLILMWVRIKALCAIF